jgi:hypothetical protein
MDAGAGRRSGRARAAPHARARGALIHALASADSGGFQRNSDACMIVPVLVSLVRAPPHTLTHTSYPPRG